MRRRYLLSGLFAALALLALLAALPAMAQTPTVDEVNAVAKKLSCPTCTGINVADCPTETCAQWRSQIGQMLAQGKSESEILDYFSSRYGDQVLQVPPTRGFFVWVWALPVAAIVVGLAFLALGMRGWARQPAAAPATAEADEAAPAGAVGAASAGEVGAASADAVGAASADAVGAASADDEYLRRVQEDLEKLK